MIREQGEQLVLRSLSNKLNELLSKDGLYRNSHIVYRMNRKLEFPLQVLAEQVRSITSREDLLLKALSCHEIAAIDQVTRRVKLRYRGGEKVVVVTGIRREFIEEMLRHFQQQTKRKVKMQLRNGKHVLECQSEEVARLLKKHIRETKKWYDLHENGEYKSKEHQKIRIVIEGEELYTLLVDSVFEEERRQFITTLEERPGIYEPIALPIKDYSGEAVEQDELMSEDRTSTNMSETQDARRYKQEFETQKQDAHTQSIPPDQDPSKQTQETECKDIQVCEQQPQAKPSSISPPKEPQIAKPTSVQPNPCETTEIREVPVAEPPTTEAVQPKASSSSEEEGGQQIQLQKLAIPAKEASKQREPSEEEEEQPGVYSFEYIDNLFEQLKSNQSLLRPDRLNHKKVDVAADDHGHKKFFDKVYERSRQRQQRKLRESQDQADSP